ncbi:hypothetical protein NWF32_12875 [Pseudomonas qingdaonensis]|nr:hypothetical protein [Pseudomonas qingdaonensis]
MGTIEDVKGVGKEVLTRDEQLQVAAAQRAELDARNEKFALSVKNQAVARWESL